MLRGNSAKRVLEVIHVRKQVAYVEGLRILKEEQQAKLVAHREGTPVPKDCVILLEHPPVYTLGRNADPSNVLFDAQSSEVEVHRVERGGEVTYHGPGQVVGYPVMDLRRHKQDLHWYMRQVEEVVIQTLDTYSLKGSRKEKYTGVWVENGKVAAIGLNASKWITSHGFALNVTTNLKDFDRIIPCGIDEEGLHVTSIEKLLEQGGQPTSQLGRMQAQERLVKAMMSVFSFDRCVIREI